MVLNNLCGVCLVNDWNSLQIGEVSGEDSSYSVPPVTPVSPVFGGNPSAITYSTDQGPGSLGWWGLVRKMVEAWLWSLTSVIFFFIITLRPSPNGHVQVLDWEGITIGLCLTLVAWSGGIEKCTQMLNKLRNDFIMQSWILLGPKTHFLEKKW